MPRTKKGTPPSYRKHSKGQAVVTLPDGLGHRRDVLLGPHGSRESGKESARALAEWEAAGGPPPEASPPPSTGISVNELLLAYGAHAEQHYRHTDGSPTSEVDE